MKSVAAYVAFAVLVACGGTGPKTPSAPRPQPPAVAPTPAPSPTPSAPPTSTPTPPAPPTPTPTPTPPPSQPPPSEPPQQQPPTSQPPTVQPPDTGPLVRKLGGQGDEWARGLAACPDGSVVSVLASGPPRDDQFHPMFGFVLDPHDQPTLGVGRLERSGDVRWSRSFDVAGAVVDVRGVTCSAQSIAIALFVSRGAISIPDDTISGSGLLLLAPAGGTMREFPLSGELESVAAGPDGELAVATDGPPTIALLGPDGAPRWKRTFPAAWGRVRAAVAPDGAVAAVLDAGYAAPGRIVQLSRDGELRWSTVLGARLDQVAVAADGRVYAGGPYIGALEYAGTQILQSGPGVVGFVAVTAPDGTPLLLRKRTGNGPFRARADGRLELLETRGVTEYYPVPRSGACFQELVSWDPDGTERARTRIARCDPPPDAVAWWGPWWSALAITPAGDVWLQGDGKGRFDAGTGEVAAEARDVFLLRTSR